VGCLSRRQRLHFARAQCPTRSTCPSYSWSGDQPNHTSGGIRRQMVIKIVESGAKIVSSIRGRSTSAGIADMWIKASSGGRRRPCMGLLKVVVDEELYDKDFVRDWTVGFERPEGRGGHLHARRCCPGVLGARGPDPHACPHDRPEQANLPALGQRDRPRGPTFPDPPGHLDPGCHHGQLNVPGGIVLPTLRPTSSVRASSICSAALPIAGKTIAKNFR